MSKASLLSKFLSDDKPSNIIEVPTKYLGSFMIETGFDITSVKEFDIMIRKYHKINLIIIKKGGKVSYETCFANGSYRQREPTHNKVSKIRRVLSIMLLILIIIGIVGLIVLFR